MHKDQNSNLNKYQKEYESVSMDDEAIRIMKQRIEQGKRDKKIIKIKNRWRGLAVAAAAAFVLVLLPNTSSSVAYAMEQIPLIGNMIKLVTFRDYHYENDRKSADVSVSKIDIQSEKINGQSAENAKKSSAEINAEIQKITNQWIKEFKTGMESDGYENISVKSEAVQTTENYFTLKLTCYQGAGSGFEQDYFYTINLNTGMRMRLSDLFIDGCDYRTVISENIKDQMRKQMKENENVYYWLEDKEIPEWNFEKIPENASFYVNRNNEIVICFNEGDVAPMYMGTVKFVIPNDLLCGIRK